MEEKVKALLATTTLRVPQEAFALIRLPASVQPDPLSLMDRIGSGAFLSLIRTAEEITLLTPEAVWDGLAHIWPKATVERGWRLITLEQEISLDLAGYLAPLAQALASAGIPLLVVSSFATDHLLVQGRYLDTALRVLQAVIDEAARDISSPA